LFAEKTLEGLVGILAQVSDNLHQLLDDFQQVLGGADDLRFLSVVVPKTDLVEHLLDGTKDARHE
jgi:hypothetical protein